MSELIPILRALIRDEMANLRLGEIGVVTAVFPHAEGDAHNYECSLKLRDGDLELRRVPMCTPHIGMSSAPRVGDLVLVTYIHGDTNNPVVIGRLYSDTSPPPVHEDKAWHVESPYQDKTSITLAADGAVQVTAGKTTLTMKKDGEVEIAGEAALKIKVKGAINIEGDATGEITVSGDATVSASNVTIKAGNINLGEGGSGVITEMSHPACLFTGAPFKGSASVKAKM